ncbi:hypothetical protein P154DRAFT_623196 [Amniculicola lignicola CBS 123094]|uniref:Telomeric single stranded DNA binding POT1/Cdc13 domain-containing protein n=1 Tax=Amniculicola lignicola CBS 123094 TaxID=1392246 RepID=A0A6A5W669_9PLEO|nr:hypothetical protein P154DRAFT_623196 [Amniculicola lignicola CBS 123094]
MDLTPIAELSPELSAPDSRHFKAVITLLWPYSSSTRQCAFLLADSDIRRRRNRGQVRVRFAGSSARIVAEKGIGIGDELVLGLKGARFVRDEEEVRTPGRSIDWELEYKQTLVLQVFRDGSEFAKLDIVDAAPGSPVRQPFVESPSQAPTARVGEIQQWTSPAFRKRVRLSDGPIFEAGGFDPLVEGSQDGHKRKRPRKSFGNWNVWTYSARTPSPEKDDVGSDAGYESIAESPTRPTQALPVTPISPRKPMRYSVAAKPLPDVQDIEVTSDEPEEVSISVEPSIDEQVDNSSNGKIGAPEPDANDFERDEDYYNLYAGPNEIPPWSQDYAQGGDTEPNTEEESEDGTQKNAQDVHLANLALEDGEDEHTMPDETVTMPEQDERSFDLTASSTVGDQTDQHAASKEVDLMSQLDGESIGYPRLRERSGTQEDPYMLDDAPQLVMPPPSLPTIQTQFPPVSARGLLIPIGRQPLSPVIKPLDSSTLPMPSPLPGDQDANTSSYLDRIPPKEKASQSAPIELEDEEPRSEPGYVEESSFFSSVSASNAPAFHPTHESAFTDVRFTFGIDESAFSRYAAASKTSVSVDYEGHTLPDDFQLENEYPSIQETASAGVQYPFGLDGSQKAVSSSPEPAESNAGHDNEMARKEPRDHLVQHEEITHIDDSSVRFSFGVSNTATLQEKMASSSPPPMDTTMGEEGIPAQSSRGDAAEANEIDVSSVRFSLGQGGTVSYPQLPVSSPPVPVENAKTYEHHDVQEEPEDISMRDEADLPEYEHVQLDDNNVFDSFTVQDEAPMSSGMNTEYEKMSDGHAPTVSQPMLHETTIAAPPKAPEVIVLSSDDESDISEDESEDETEEVASDEGLYEEPFFDKYNRDPGDSDNVEESGEENGFDNEVSGDESDEDYSHQVPNEANGLGPEVLVPHVEDHTQKSDEGQEDTELAQTKDPQSLDALVEAALEAVSPAPLNGTNRSNLPTDIIDLGSGSESDEEEGEPILQTSTAVQIEDQTSVVDNARTQDTPTLEEEYRAEPTTLEHDAGVKAEHHEGNDCSMDEEPSSTMVDEDDVMVDAPPSTQMEPAEHLDIKMESIEDETPLLYESQYNPEQEEGESVADDEAAEIVIAVPEAGHKIGELQLISVASTAPARNTRSKTKASLSPVKDATPVPQPRLNTRRSKLASTSRARTTLSPIDLRSRSTLSPTKDAPPESPYQLRSRSKLQSLTRSTTPPTADGKDQTAYNMISPIRDSSPESSSNYQHLELPEMSFEASQELGTSQGKFAHVSYVKDSEEGSLHSEHSLSTVPYSDDYEAMDIHPGVIFNDPIEANKHMHKSGLSKSGLTGSRKAGNLVLVQAKTQWKFSQRESVALDEDEEAPGETTPKANAREQDIVYPGFHAGETPNPSRSLVNSEREKIPDPVDQITSSPPLQHTDLPTSVNEHSIMNSHLPITPDATQQSFIQSQPTFPQSHVEQSLPMSPQLTQATIAGPDSFKHELEMKKVTILPLTELYPSPKPMKTGANGTSALIASPDRSPSLHSEDLSGSDIDIQPANISLPTIGLSTPISYYTPLKDLTFFLNRSSQHHGGSNPDILALVTKSTTLPKRAEKGPRHYNTTLHITDLSSHPSTTTVQIFRPFASALPVAETGDVILLRRFSVKSLNRKAMLISGEESSWCVWRWGKPLWGKKSGGFGEVRGREEVRGPPVECGEGEWAEVERLRGWWRDVVVRERGGEGEDVGVETGSKGKEGVSGVNGSQEG